MTPPPRTPRGTSAYRAHVDISAKIDDAAPQATAGGTGAGRFAADRPRPIGPANRQVAAIPPARFNNFLSLMMERASPGGRCMLLVVLIALMTGLVLGTRYRFLILIPATVFAATAILAVGLTHRDDIGSMVVAMLIAAICLQAGYVTGLCARYAAVMMRAARIRRALPHTERAVSGHAH